MSAKKNSVDALVDEFVSFVNRAQPGPKFPQEIPAELRTSEAEYGMFHWQIRTAPSNPWIEDLVHRLPQLLPEIFRPLVSRYRFCTFEVGPVRFFSNTGESIFDELSTSVFRDKGLFPTLHRNG